MHETFNFENNFFSFQLFKGIFYYCDGPDAEKGYIHNKTECLALSGNGNRWVNHKYNFDNLGQALMSLFVLSSKDGWVSIMYQGLDAVGIDQQVRYLISLLDSAHLMNILSRNQFLGKVILFRIIFFFSKVGTYNTLDFIGGIFIVR